MLTNLLTELGKLSEDEIKELDVDFPSMTFTTGGTVYNAVNTKEVLSKTRLKAFIQLYGSTEACGMISMDDDNNFVPGSAGLLVPNYQMKVLNEMNILKTIYKVALDIHIHG